METALYHLRPHFCALEYDCSISPSKHTSTDPRKIWRTTFGVTIVKLIISAVQSFFRPGISAVPQLCALEYQLCPHFVPWNTTGKIPRASERPQTHAKFLKTTFWRDDTKTYYIICNLNFVPWKTIEIDRPQTHAKFLKPTFVATIKKRTLPHFAPWHLHFERF